MDCGRGPPSSFLTILSPIVGSAIILLLKLRDSFRALHGRGLDWRADPVRDDEGDHVPLTRYSTGRCAIVKAHALMESVSANPHEFLHSIDMDLTRPRKEFLRDGLVGLLRAARPIVCRMARKLPDRRTKFLLPPGPPSSPRRTNTCPQPSACRQWTSRLACMKTLRGVCWRPARGRVIMLLHRGEKLKG